MWKQEKLSKVYVMEIEIIMFEKEGSLVIRVTGQRSKNLTRDPILPRISIFLISCLKNKINNKNLFLSHCLLVFSLDNTSESPSRLDYICTRAKLRQDQR